MTFSRIYYEKNKEHIFAHLKEMRLCEECNREYHLYRLSRHIKSKKHIKNSELKKDIKNYKYFILKMYE